MSHKTMVGGTAYEIVGGKTLLDGTARNVSKGRTLVGGTGYDINFSKFVLSYTGEHTVYGNEDKGWIEMLTSGTLTIQTKSPCDIYLISSGTKGTSGTYTAGGLNTDDVVTGGNGGDGGAYLEKFDVTLNGSYNVTIGATCSSTTKANQTTLGAYTTSGKQNNGGTGAKINGDSMDYTVVNASTKGGNGRKPFTGNSPMSQGFAQYQLGAGGGGGLAQYTSGVQAASSGGTYGGGNGGLSPAAKANTGSGGGGGNSTFYSSSNTTAGGKGGSGIAIVRWGY